jgi:hypothetical protein
MVADIIALPISQFINSAFETSNFPQSLKLANVTPSFRKGDKFLKENYRPVSILPCLSKNFERIIFDQLSLYFDNSFDSRLCGFRAKHNTQHALLRMIGQWHQCLDRSGNVGAILMDLSKAFDCIDHNLLIAKLSAYGLEIKSLSLVKCYLSNRYQRTKIGSNFSSWLRIIKGVPQGSILGPLLFNIFINDLLFVISKTDMCNFADDNSLFSCAKTLNEVVSNLKFDIANVLEWFSLNLLKPNPSKFQMLVIGEKNLPICIRVGDLVLNAKNSVELLGITIDCNLTFFEHIKSLCVKARYKVWSLNRIRRFLDNRQLILLFNAYIVSTFSYAPVVWMFCSKTLSKEITRVHKRALRAVFSDFVSSYEILLQNCNFKSIHDLHLSQLLCEVYKTVNRLNPIFMQNLFQIKTVSYSLRNQQLLSLPPARSQRFGTQSFLFRGSFLWNLIPDKIKLQVSIDRFKTLLKEHSLEIFCSCKICI